MRKILKALAVVGEGYGNAPDQLAVASTDGSQLAVFASAPPATEALKFKGEVVLPIVIMAEDEHQARGIRYDLLQQRLTAADERVGALGSLVPEAELALKALNVAVSVYDVELADSARRGLRLIIAALKPAEPAKDERVCPGCGTKGYTACCTQCVPY